MRDEFYQGVCAVLAMVAQADEEVLWREIVAGCGGYDHLRSVSKRCGNLRMDGFARYKKPTPMLVATTDHLASRSKVMDQ